jgi:putative membrane protein insertion efficiency factor
MKILTFLLQGYQKFISPLFAPRCKYYPSCSQYALDSLCGFGARGTFLAFWRLLRCNPFSHGGVDYIPERFLGRDSRIDKSLINQGKVEVSA